LWRPLDIATGRQTEVDPDANLAWSAWLFLGFVRGRMPFARLEHWQTVR